jgi:hypothetical protein
MMEMYPARGLASIGDPGDMPFSQCRQLRKFIVAGNSNRVAPGQGQMVETARFARYRRLDSIEIHFPPVRISVIMSDEYWYWLGDRYAGKSTTGRFGRAT